MPMSPPAPDESPPTRVLLVRHGQSEWNADGRWQGQADPPLTDLGRLQAREAARALGAVDAVWASDLQRAVETATIIADDLGVGPVVLDPDLRERDAGEFSGLTRPEIADRFPGYLDDGRRPPGWEPDEALLARALRALHAASPPRSPAATCSWSPTAGSSTRSRSTSARSSPASPTPRGGGSRSARARRCGSASASCCRRPRTRTVPDQI